MSVEPTYQGFVISDKTPEIEVELSSLKDASRDNFEVDWLDSDNKMDFMEHGQSIPGPFHCPRQCLA